MKTSLLRGLLFSIALMAIAVSSPIYADEVDPGLSDATKGGIGCLVTSGAVLTAGLWAGPSELVMIAAGGLLVPSAVTPLMVGLTATVVTASCGVGTAATPAALWLAEQVGVILAHPDTTSQSN